MINNSTQIVTSPAHYGHITAAEEEEILAAADFSSRAMAFLVDAAILTCLHLGCLLVYSHLLFQTVSFDISTFFGASMSCFFLFFATPPLAAGIYFTVLHACGGQTLGKVFMGIKVVSLDGGPVSPGVGFLRCVGYIVSFLPFMAGFLWAVLDKEHAAWHDRIAGTRVVVM